MSNIILLVAAVADLFLHFQIYFDDFVIDHQSNKDGTTAILTHK